MRVKQLIKIILVSLGASRLVTLYGNRKHKDIVYNVNHTQDGKRCLFLYITEPFCTKEVLDIHQNQWQAVEFARIIGSRGFVVDVADYQNKSIKLRNKYDLVIGLIPRGIDIYSNYMNPGCLQIAYLTSMNLAVTTANEQQRLDDLYKRRGVKLKQRRGSDMVIEKRIETFDAAWYIGNEYNYHSYDVFKMPPVHYIKNTGYVFPWADSNADRDPHSFMFFGSAGQVHKGLDLLLEIFAEDIKDCRLYVCGCYESEDDFRQEYHKELYETSNIFPVGFVNIHSSKYQELSNICAYSILPSCAEGCAGSVLTNMSAGMIPIVSRECGFDEDDVISLPDCQKSTIRDYILMYCQKDSEWVKSQSRRAIQVVKERYNDNVFRQTVQNALDGLLNAK